MTLAIVAQEKNTSAVIIRIKILACLTISNLVCGFVDIIYPSKDTEGEIIPSLKKGAKVRIVSNGIEARMYQVSGEENPVLLE